MSDSDEFARLTDPYRPELMAHCYRMLGSVHDAEDLVQETYLRAWRGYAGFEGRASLRTWLYKIATTTCLKALERRARRPMPTGLGAPSDTPEAPLDAGRTDIPWLQPMPDALLLGSGPDEDPGEIVASRGSIRLAFVAALQHLPARQRAVLLLRDVLDWRAAEVAELLGTTTTAVNSALRRARAQLAEVAPAQDELAEPPEPEHRALLDRYVAAFESNDMATLLELLRDDVVVEMPPFLEWFAGRPAVGRFFAARIGVDPRRRRFLPTRANGQPATALYLREDRVYRPHSVQLLTVRASRITRIIAFLDTGLFATFGLPDRYDAAAAPSVRR